MELEFTGPVWFWRGPSPFFFVTVPEAQSEQIKAISNLVTYGWGMIPVHARIGKTEWQTSLWPKNDAYIVPIKASVRKAEGLNVAHDATVRLVIDL